ncbi:cold shock domain-containing protein [Marinomonas posidonica]|uniref:Cold-shock DNA-binding domain protein n=1 Tax=Marinomonas posidonica (strain CECT 7376 / NCIMB 14433 / IVIA-Po-181) TaxID=491952 RepID=F6CTH2_MARPP|nr:cold shock domain-containing protein [Marinomonas posidonica]AEF54021.1 cold-shock DNA-binding domain protein [Marinomonas posidonica IVIA-Po-181]
MHHGSVKWFNNAKGYGFIVSEDFNEDLFIHYSAINVEGYKTLKAGQAVTFDVEPGERGLHAIEINPISTEVNNKPPANENLLKEEPKKETQPA